MFYETIIRAVYESLSLVGVFMLFQRSKTSKAIKHYHNWIVYEKDTRFDICTECGQLKKYEYHQPILASRISPKYDEDENETINFFENLGDKRKWQKEQNEKIDKELDLKRVKKAIKKLPKRYQKIIDLYFFKKLSLRKVAKKLKISHQRVHQLLFGLHNKKKKQKGAIEKLREILKTP